MHESPLALTPRLRSLLTLGLFAVVACGGRTRGASSGSGSGALVSGGATTTGVTSGSSAGVVIGGSGSGTLASGADSGSRSTGSGTGSTSGATTSGVASGVTSGSAGGSGIGAESGTGSVTCPGPSRYIDSQQASCTLGKCICAGNAYSLDGGACTCEEGLPTLCTYDAGQPPQCVEETLDPNNCGGCGVKCKISAACNGGTCGTEPTQLVPPAPGCVSMRVVYDSGSIYWSDMGHGTISSIPVGGGPVTTMVSGLNIAAVQTPEGPLQWPYPPGLPLSTALLVHGGTVYWVGASASVQCPEDAGGACFGGVGATLMSATSGGSPKTLLTMAPGPSPVSATDASDSLETPGQSPPINAIALSPDGNTLYFAAGTRFYSIPSTGAGAVTYVGYTEGPEHGEATALAADQNYLYYPTNFSGNVEVVPIAQMCDFDAAENERCPYRVGEGQGELDFDTIQVKGNFVYWGDNTSVRRGNVAAAVAGSLDGYDLPRTFNGTDETGFAVGTQYAYFGEPGGELVCSQDPSTPCVPMLPASSTCDASAGSCQYACQNAVYGCPDVSPAHQTCVTGLGYVEKGAVPPFDGDVPPSAIILARNQPNAMSFALDGTNVYWTTSRCDISYIADSPQ